MKKCKKSNTALNIEIILAILIAICVIALMAVHEQHDREVNERYLETLLVSSEQLGIIDPELKELIIEYRPRPYKMIEVYDDEFNLTLRLQFKDEAINVKDDITNHPELIEYFQTHSEGHTYYTINNDETNVYFKWCKMEGQDHEQLAIIYTSRAQSSNYWLHSTICYIILVLAFSIVIVSLLKRGHDRVHQYRSNQKSIFDSISR